MSGVSQPLPTLAELRRDLSAALRLAARFDLHEGICNHFSVAVPGAEERYLINAYGLHWSEIGPDDVLLIDGEGTVLAGAGEVEASARNIHIAAHRANPRHLCILHTHMPYATALTMLEGGRLEMAHQTATRFHGRTLYVERFGGVALNPEEGEKIAAANRTSPDVDIVFLAHHGVMVGGSSVALAFDDLYYLERACRQQVLAMSTGKALRILPDELIDATARQWRQTMAPQSALHFEALRRINGY